MPVHGASGDYIYGERPLPEEEKQAFGKIYNAAANSKNVSVGTVRSYICTPDGHPIFNGAMDVEEQIATLKRVIKQLGVPEGKTLVEPRNQNAPPKAEPDALALHVTTRPVPAVKWNDFFGALPGEAWVVYGRKDWTKFLPADGAAPGTSWDVDRDIAIKLLSNFYPSGEEYGYVMKGEYERVSMKATLLSKDRVRLDVSLRMREWFIHAQLKGPAAPVEATAVGVVDIDPAKKTIKRFVMATEKATVEGGFLTTFGVAVRSVP